MSDRAKEIKEGTDKLHSSVNGMIDMVLDSHGLTNSQVVGVLEMVKAEFIQRGIEEHKEKLKNLPND